MLATVPAGKCLLGVEIPSAVTLWLWAIHSERPELLQTHAPESQNTEPLSPVTQVVRNPDQPYCTLHPPQRTPDARGTAVHPDAVGTGSPDLRVRVYSVWRFCELPDNMWGLLETPCEPPTFAQLLGSLCSQSLSNMNLRSTVSSRN